MAFNYEKYRNVTYNFLTYFMTTVGIAYKGRYHRIARLWIIAEIVSITAVLLNQLAKMFTMKDENPFAYIRCASYVIHGFCPNIVVILIFLKTTEMIELMDIRQDVFRRTTDRITAAPNHDDSIVRRNFVDNDRTTFDRLIWPYGYIFMLVLLVDIMLGPIIIFALTDSDYDSDFVNIYMFWSPWKIDTTVKYLVSYAIQFTELAVTLIPVEFNLFFNIYFMTEIRAQRTILLSCIREIIPRTRTLVAEATKNHSRHSLIHHHHRHHDHHRSERLYDETLSRYFGEIIERYRFLLL